MTNDEEKQIREYQSVQYARELTEYWNAYISSAINEIFVGIAILYGMPESEAYYIAKHNPNDDMLSKGFFMNIFEKFKSIFNYKTDKFRIQKKKKKVPEWNVISKQIDDYWQRIADKANEDVIVKSFLIGRDTAKFRKQDIQYRNISLPVIKQKYHNNKMPSNVKELIKTYDMKNSEKKAIARSLQNVSTLVTEVKDDVKDTIREYVTKGYKEKGKAAGGIKSDLFWNVQKKKKWRSAESCRRNWNRIAVTEMQTIYESGILAQYEDEAVESLTNIRRAQYFVFTGGSCKWCLSTRGTIVRLIPSDIAKDANNDSLSAMGIEDPITDIAIWIGKNNRGRYSYKEPFWMVCTPAHPHNVATFEPIDPETEGYNPKKDRIERKQQFKNKYLPEKREYNITDEEKENRRPRFISSDRVQYNNNIYERVSPEAYERAKQRWDENPMLPIPVSTESTRYDKIFGEAERNQK